MKLKYINDVDKFFDMINQCAGKVEVVSEEGDRLNLRSKLCQLVAKTILTSGEVDLEILAYNQEDVMRIMNYMMNQ